MNDVAIARHVTEAADRALRSTPVIQGPYFRALLDGSMPLELFRRTQEQFFFAVTFFPRPMAALVGRIPDPHQRLDILHNLIEEHGEFDATRFHHTTFQQFLRTLGSDPAKLDELTLWPAVRAFNSVLTASCVLDELEVAIGAMGIIEYAFADVSAVIGKAVVDRGWVSEVELVHYKLHAEIDKRHAAEFFAVVEPGWDDPRRRYYIEQGLALGAYVFDRLYRDLLEAASDRRV
jgi:pyrroloquinoline-quinone synthase